MEIIGIPTPLPSKHFHGIVVGAFIYKSGRQTAAMIAHEIPDVRLVPHIVESMRRRKLISLAQLVKGCDEVFFLGAGDTLVDHAHEVLDCVVLLVHGAPFTWVRRNMSHEALF